MNFPCGLLYTMMLPPEPYSTLTLPRSVSTVMSALAVASLILTTGLLGSAAWAGASATAKASATAAVKIAGRNAVVMVFIFNLLRKLVSATALAWNTV